MAEPWPIHTLVFDLDDTLYPERDYVLSGFSAVGAWLQERGFAGFAARAEALFAAGRRGTIFDEALVSMDVGLRPPIADLVNIYRDHRPAIHLPAESVELLEWSHRQFRLALVSDGYLIAQQRKAAALELARWFDPMVFSDQWGRESWKPSVRAFEEVARRQPGAVHGYLYVADNPRKDFIAPRKLGWRTVRLRRAGGEHALYEPASGEAADVEIAGLAELRSLIVPAG